jgi:hypothetical protein
MIGTTRSRVSHFMNKFRQLGFINYNGHLEVHSSLLSVVLSEHGRHRSAGRVSGLYRLPRFVAENQVLKSRR